MVTRGRWGVRCWRAVGPAALLFLLAIPQVGPVGSLTARAAAAPASAVGPDLSTYAGAPAAGKPTEVAQQPFGLATLGRYTFIADPTNHVVRLLIDNTEVTFAGGGSMAAEQGNGDLAEAQLAGPYAVAIGRVTSIGFHIAKFDVYIADTFAHQIRKAVVSVPNIDNPTAPPTAVISAFAGNGSFGFGGDGSAASRAQLNSPYGVAWDPNRDLVYIADTLNNRVRAVDSRGIIRTLIAKPLDHPRGLLVSGDSLYIADTYNNMVRRFDLSAGTLTTVAGTGTAGFVDGGTSAAALLNLPSGLATNGTTLYIADTGNHAVRSLGGDGVLRTIAGTGRAGEAGDGSLAIKAQLSSPAGVAVRPNGDVVIADTGNNLVRVIDYSVAAGPTHIIHVEAGNGTPGFAGDGQPPGKAQFAAPASVLSKLAPPGTTDASIPAVKGQRYVVDTFNQVLRTFETSGVVSTLAGKGGVRGPAATGLQSGSNARFAYPMGSAIRGDTLYVADTFNNVVRAVDLVRGTVKTVAGTPGQSGFAGDGLVATSALLSYPMAVAVDQAGNLFIADTYNGRIREVVGSNIYTVAGTGRLGFSGEGGPGTSADLYLPSGVSVDGSTPPNLYITDSFNHRIRKLAAVSPINATTHRPLDSRASNLITTVAGTGDQEFADGSALGAAKFNRPWSAAFDQTNLFVADYLNHRVRRIDLAARTVSTLAGQPTPGLLGDAGPASKAELNSPRGLSMLGDSGGMLVADSFNSRIRWLGMSQAAIQRTQINFDPTNLAGQSPPQSVTVTSTGSGLLVMKGVDLNTDQNNFYLDPAKNGCAQSRLEPATSCSFDVAFQPRDPGGHTGSVLVRNDAIGGPQLITLKGEATSSVVTFNPPAVVINQPINGPAQPAIVTLTNNGDGVLHIASIGLDATSSPDFFQSNNCPSGMAPHSSCQITITLSQIGPDDKAARSGTLVVRDDAAGNTTLTSHFVPLTGSLAQPMASFNHQSLVFTQNLGTNSGSQTIIMTNTGLAPLHLSAIRDDGDFAQSNNCPTVLAPRASCVISVTFIPTNPGERDGYIVVADDSADSPQRIPVTGIGTMSLAQLGPSRLTFTQSGGGSSAPQMVTLTNRGDGPLNIGAVTTTGDFTAAAHCPATLLPGMSCSIGVTFTPKASGARSGTLTVTTDGNALVGAQQSVRLTGFSYQPVASLSASVLSPAVNLGSSLGQRVMVTNKGDGALTIRAIGISGAAAADYAQSSNCLRTLQPGEACAVMVTFTPRAYGPRNASLTLTDNAQGGSQSVALRGTGTAARPLLSAAFMNFGGAAVGSRTVPQSVVLFNSGNGTLLISAINVTGSDFILTTNCGRTLGPGLSCTITVSFLPKVVGARSGAVTITENTGSQRITLSGVGT
jgi:Abnormal spindle-like microcephaly-assoc'd, ASPM-SPD-2-Hydin/NHL repeat